MLSPVFAKKQSYLLNFDFVTLNFCMKTPSYLLKETFLHPHAQVPLTFCSSPPPPHCLNSSFC